MTPFISTATAMNTQLASLKWQSAHHTGGDRSRSRRTKSAIGSVAARCGRPRAVPAGEADRTRRHLVHASANDAGDGATAGGEAGKAPAARYRGEQAMWAEYPVAGAAVDRSGRRFARIDCPFATGGASSGDRNRNAERGDVVFAVGPEGGFTEEVASSSRVATGHWRISCIETAAIAALTALALDFAWALVPLLHGVSGAARSSVTIPPILRSHGSQGYR